MFILKTTALAPMGGKILLWWGSPQKIGRTAGIASDKNQIQIFKIPNSNKG